MYLLLMRISVANVIVSNVTPISASVRPQLEVYVHFMFLESLFLHESLATEFATMSLVFVPRMNCVNVGLHVFHLDTTESALLCLLAALFPDVRLQTDFVLKPFATFVTAALLSRVFCVHVIVEPRGASKLLSTKLAEMRLLWFLF